MPLIDYKKFIGLNFIISEFSPIRQAIEIKVFGEVVKVIAEDNSTYNFKNCIFETESYK